MRLTPEAIRAKKSKKEKIVALTAYDYPFAKILDEEGVDIIMVGDSLGMVVLGYENTLSVTMSDMMHHARAVSRAVRHALVVVDMPSGSYSTPELALANAQKFIAEAGADAVKLEGGLEIEPQLKALRQKSIPVMGHLGLLPQSVKEKGGYKIQGRTKEEAEKILKDAELLEYWGAFAVVLECIPQDLGERITRKISIPTIGIGAGAQTDGQILVTYDLLGFEGAVKPRFVRTYAGLNLLVRNAVHHFQKDVQTGNFPSAEESY